MNTLFKYALAAVLVIIVFQSCHHADGPLPFPRNYMAKMGGQRHWQGVDSGRIAPPGAADQTSKEVIDDNFALTINTTDSTVYCPKNFHIFLTPLVEGQHKLIAFDSALHTMTFWGLTHITNGTYIATPFADYIVYHYDIDRIEIFAEDHASYGQEHIYLKSE